MKKELLSSMPASWKKFLASEFESKEFNQLCKNLTNEIAGNKICFPKTDQIFSAFKACPPDQVKVVILGQDPYHNFNQAHGLSFSVLKGNKIPPSLKNIFKELHQDIGFQIPFHGELQAWADQGVLLLNSCLTVEAHKPNSHSKFGWNLFTDSVIERLAQNNKHIVFILWGAFAQKKKELIKGEHLILEAPHPSPLSAHRGFLGCQHFSKTNQWLHSKNKTTIDWDLPLL